MSLVMEKSLVLKDHDDLKMQVWSDETALFKALMAEGSEDWEEVQKCEKCGGFTAHGPYDGEVDECSHIGAEVYQRYSREYGCLRCAFN